MIRTYAILIIGAIMFSCSAKMPAPYQLPANEDATAETVNLYLNLHKQANNGFLFGHQDDLAYGVEWKYETGRSDVKDVAGDYPALYGWELGGLETGENDKNLDGVPFSNMKQYIKEGYERGGVITLSWHMMSPFGYEKGAWDTTHGSVASILPGGSNHIMYQGWLNRFADFVSALRGSENEAIPILFRPFHELTGNWFWWCSNACSTEEYKSLWRFTYEYLQKKKGLNNLLWVYNTAGDFNTAEEYLERYPGDDFVDVISFDTYQQGDLSKGKQFEEDTHRRLTLAGGLAAGKGKLLALAETGYEQVPDAHWWTGTLMRAIGNNKIAYTLVWRNHGYHEGMKKMHYYAPYKNQLSAPDFKAFYELDNTWFEKDAKHKNLYKK